MTLKVFPLIQKKAFSSLKTEALACDKEKIFKEIKHLH